MKGKTKSVIRTLSEKYQLTIPKRFGEDLGLEPLSPVSITEDSEKRRIVIEAVVVSKQAKQSKKEAFVEACRVLGKKWEKLGVSEKDIDQAIREFRSAG